MAPVGILQTYQPPASQAQTTFDLLLNLDSFANPGITRREFYRLFVECSRCRLVMTRRVVGYHRCARAAHAIRRRSNVQLTAVIDLTVDNGGVDRLSSPAVIDLTVDSD